MINEDEYEEYEDYAENLFSWPEEIWLRTSNGDGSVPVNRNTVCCLDDVTWSEEKVNGGDIKYIRSDIVQKMIREHLHGEK